MEFLSGFPKFLKIWIGNSWLLIFQNKHLRKSDFFTAALNERHLGTNYFIFNNKSDGSTRDKKPDNFTNLSIWNFPAKIGLSADANISDTKPSQGNSSNCQGGGVSFSTSTLKIYRPCYCWHSELHKRAKKTVIVLSGELWRKQWSQKISCSQSDKAVIEKYFCSRHPPALLENWKTRFADAVKSREF